METKQAVKIKTLLFAKCMEKVDETLEMLKSAIQSMKDSSESESKSTAGDKHETGRAMMHLEQEKNAKQLAEALAVKEKLVRLEKVTIQETVAPGCLVLTNQGKYFLGVGLGKIILGKDEFFAVSSEAPLAKSLLGKKAGDKLSFNGKEILIEQVA